MSFLDDDAGIGADWVSDRSFDSDPLPLDSSDAVSQDLSAGPVDLAPNPLRKEEPQLKQDANALLVDLDEEEKEEAGAETETEPAESAAAAATATAADADAADGEAAAPAPAAEAEPAEPEKTEEELEREFVAAQWKSEEELSLDDRRHRYRCGADFVSLADLKPWTEDQVENNLPGAEVVADVVVDDELAGKISHWRGDITRLEIDAVVNAANERCLGGGGIDGAIHRAAGRRLLAECRTLHGCETGFTKATRGYNLPAKYVLHTVGPIGRKDPQLKSCYETCLDEVERLGIRSVAFCGVSTGIFGFPLMPASRIAVQTARKWLETGDNRTKVDRIIFCTFLAEEKAAYEEIIPEYFPTTRDARVREEKEAEARRVAEEAEAKIAAAEAAARAAAEAQAAEARQAAEKQARAEAAEEAARAKAEAEAAEKVAQARAEAASLAAEESRKALQRQAQPNWTVWALAAAAAAGVVAFVALRRR